MGALAMLAAEGARADCSLTGQVKQRDLPVADADISTVLGTASPVSRGHSTGDGRFAVSVEALPRDMQVLKLVVSKPGSGSVTRLLAKDRETGCPIAPQGDIGLDPGLPTGGAGASGTDSSLCAQRSSLGLTVFIAPYRIYGTGADQAAEGLNQDLPEIVHHRILAFESSLSGDVTFPDISVETICLPLTSAQGEKAQQVGHNLNGLGVIAGEGELREEQGRTVIDLVSVLRTIPAYKSLGAVPLSIEDTIPSDRLRPSRVAEQMRDLWGKQIVVAYALQRLASLPAAPDPAEIAQLRALMVALRKTMTGDDPVRGQVEQIQALLAGLGGGP